MTFFSCAKAQDDEIRSNKTVRILMMIFMVEPLSFGIEPAAVAAEVVEPSRLGANSRRRRSLRLLETRPAGTMHRLVWRCRWAPGSKANSLDGRTGNLRDRTRVACAGAYRGSRFSREPTYSPRV